MKYYIQNNQLYKVRTALGEGYDLSETNSLVDFQAGKIITLNAEQIEFYKANRNATTQEIFDCALAVIEVPEPTLEQVKAMKIIEISAYDMSSEINSFIVNSLTMWIDRNTRSSLMSTIAAYKSQGKESITLWTEGNNPLSITMPVDTLETLLLSLEIYAKECYDITAMHKHVVSNLETITKIRGYDYTSGYPEKLNIITNEQEGSNTTA